MWLKGNILKMVKNISFVTMHCFVTSYLMQYFNVHKTKCLCMCFARVPNHSHVITCAIQGRDKNRDKFSLGLAHK